MTTAGTTLSVTIYDETGEDTVKHQASICLSASFKSEMMRFIDKPLHEVTFQIIKSKKASEGFNVNGYAVSDTATVEEVCGSDFEKLGIVSADDLSFIPIEEINKCENSKEVLVLVRSKVDALKKLHAVERAKDDNSDFCMKILESILSVRKLQKVLEDLETEHEVPNEEDTFTKFETVSLAGEAPVVGTLEVVIPAVNGNFIATFEYSKFNHASDVFIYLETNNSLKPDQYILTWGTEVESSKMESYYNLFTYFGTGGRVFMKVSMKAGGAWSVLKHTTKPEAVRALKARAKSNWQGNRQP